MLKLFTLVNRISDEVSDPRRTSHGHLLHELVDIIAIGFCTILCGGETFEEMEDFGNVRREWLSQFLALRNGIPDADTFRRCFERINPKELANCLYNWLEIYRGSRAVVSIDGKTIRGSGNNDHSAYHVVSAFISDNHLTLGEVTVAEKSNEITAVPELLDLIDVSGSIVTADAMSCQTKIVEKIHKSNADYVIGLKSNQKNLYEAAKEYRSNINIEDIPYIESSEKNHGRIEKRRYYLITDLKWLPSKKEWKGLNAIGVAESDIASAKTGKTHFDRRYFITSLTDINEFANSVRKHWGIENNLHWSLDVDFGEDRCLAKKDNSPKNLNVMRKTALSILANTNMGKRVSKKRKMFRAAMDFNILDKFLMGVPEIK